MQQNPNQQQQQQPQRPLQQQQQQPLQQQQQQPQSIGMQTGLGQQLSPPRTTSAIPTAMGTGMTGGAMPMGGGVMGGYQPMGVGQQGLGGQGMQGGLGQQGLGGQGMQGGLGQQGLGSQGMQGGYGQTGQAFQQHMQQVQQPQQFQPQQPLPQQVQPQQPLPHTLRQPQHQQPFQQYQQDQSHPSQQQGLQQQQLQQQQQQLQQPSDQTHPQLYRQELNQQTVGQPLNGRKLSVLIVGGSGTVGKVVVTEFLLRKDEFKSIKVMTRTHDEDARTFERQGAEIIVADPMHFESLQRVFTRDFQVDVIVSTLGGEAIREGQLNLIRAAKGAHYPISHFIPSEYGVDLTTKVEMPIFNAKIEVAKELEQSGIPWTRLFVGCFPDTTFGSWFDMDLSTGKVHICGDGNQKVCFTALHDVAKFIVECVLHPELCINRNIRVCGDCASINDAVALYEKTSGKKVTVSTYPTEHLRNKIQSIDKPNEKGKEQIILTIANGDACFKDTQLDNDKFVNVHPMSLSTFFRDSMKNNPY